MKQSISILIVLAGLLLSGCTKSVNTQAVYTGPPLNDTEFAREVFRLLAEGDTAVTPMIDWEHLNMLGVDVGAMYRGVPGEGEARPNFIKSFINSYSRSFKVKGGSAANASNWREQSRDASNTIVAADGPNGKVMLTTITHMGGHQKVSSVEVK